jgi:hypothetical protein
MLHQPPVLSCVEELTLVVVSREQPVEAPLATPPRGVTCQVFARGTTESAVLFDERLRECLDNPNLLQSLGRAVLVCTADSSDREILRRLRLVAARLKPGGLLTLSYHTPPSGPTDVHFADRLCHLARFASLALGSHRLTVDVLPLSHLAEECAPLSAAWQRLQRQRTDGLTQASESPVKRNGATVSPVTRNVTRTTVCHHRKTKSTAVTWVAAPDATAPPARALFPAVIPRQ